MTTEAIPEKIINLSPLDEVHRQSGATMAEREGWSVPTSYGDPLFEYAAIRERGAGLSDLSCRGRLLVTGTEAVQFLNGLVTNDMKTLAVNHWMPAVFSNAQGRMLASVRVIHQAATAEGAAGFLIDTEPATHHQVLNTIQRFTLAGDFHVTDLTTQTALLSVAGTGAAALLSGLCGNQVLELAPHQCAALNWNLSLLTIIRAAGAATDVFDLIVEIKSATELWKNLAAAGAQPVGFEALEILRVEAGQPRFGIDMDETNVVSETGLDGAISFTKGCYIGQEIIARIKYRGHVARKLSGLLLARAAEIEGRAKIISVDGKEVGHLTSITYSPHLGTTIALGYVKYDYLAPGTEVTIGGGAEVVPAMIVELPFVRGGE